MKKTVTYLFAALVAVLPMSPVMVAGEDAGGEPGANPMQFTTPTVLPAAEVGAEYSAYVEVTGVTNNYYNGGIIRGAIPPGMYWSISILRLFGTPTTPGVYLFEVRATDLNTDSTNSADKVFAVMVN